MVGEKCGGDGDGGGGEAPVMKEHSSQSTVTALYLWKQLWLPRAHL